MAVFGDLEHHALTDLVNVLNPQSGTLFFHEAYQGRTLELALARSGRLRAMYLDGFPVQEEGQVRDILRQLRAQGRGAFEFQRRDLPATAASFYDLPLAELVQDAAGADVPADQLPHPDTRFVAAAGGPPVPPPLAGAWALLGPHLGVGASASELAGRTGRSERDVQVTLHRLRAADLIAPLRAAVQAPQATPTAGPAPAAASPAPAPLVQRLLGALRRLTGTART